MIFCRINPSKSIHHTEKIFPVITLIYCLDSRLLHAYIIHVLVVGGTVYVRVYIFSLDGFNLQRVLADFALLRNPFTILQELTNLQAVDCDL